MIKGKGLCLTAVEVRDLQDLMNWRNNEDMRKFYREYREINEQMQMNWFNTKVVGDKDTIIFAIRQLDTQQLLGCCGLCYINWIHRNAEISIYIGEGDAYIDIRAHQALSLLLKYGYEQMGMQRLWAECYDFDKKRIAMYKDFRFKLDGVLRNNYFWGNTWHDSHIYSMLVNEYLQNTGLSKFDTPPA